MIARTEKQTYIESTIARKPVTISGNDATTQVGADLAALSYTVSGSKQVIIDKAAQTAPDASKLLTRSESRRNSLDGMIAGLTARRMEYRNKANDGAYTLAYMEHVYVEPGTYLVHGRRRQPLRKPGYGGHGGRGPVYHRVF